MYVLDSCGYALNIELTVKPQPRVLEDRRVDPGKADFG